MKVFFSDNTLKRLMKMVEDLKAGTVSIRKYKVKEDPISNVIPIKGKVNDKYRDSHLSGKFYNYYVSKSMLKEIKKLMSSGGSIGDSSTSAKQGGIIPFLPLIFAGLATAITGATTIANTVINKNAQDAKLEEEKRHNLEVEKSLPSIEKDNDVIQGQGFASQSYARSNYVLTKECRNSFIKSLNLNDSDEEKCVRNILKSLQHVLKIEKHGSALYLTPY